MLNHTRQTELYDVMEMSETLIPMTTYTYDLPAFTVDCRKSSWLAFSIASSALLPSFTPNCNSVVASPSDCPDSTESRKGAWASSMRAADSFLALSRNSLL